MINSQIIVHKRNLQGKTTLTWQAVVLGCDDEKLVITATFQSADRMELGYTVLERGDRFVEWYYFNRYYNVYAVYAQGSGQLRGWYCNICRPAVLHGEQLHCVDLALDWWVSPTGEAQLLDQAEFDALPLAAAERQQCLAAIAALQAATQDFARWQAQYGVSPNNMLLS